MEGEKFNIELDVFKTVILVQPYCKSNLDLDKVIIWIRVAPVDSRPNSLSFGLTLNMAESSLKYTLQGALSQSERRTSTSIISVQLKRFLQGRSSLHVSYILIKCHVDVNTHLIRLTSKETISLESLK